MPEEPQAWNCPTGFLWTKWAMGIWSAGQAAKAELWLHSLARLPEVCSGAGLVGPGCQVLLGLSDNQASKQAGCTQD